MYICKKYYCRLIVLNMYFFPTFLILFSGNGVEPPSCSLAFREKFSLYIIIIIIFFLLFICAIPTKKSLVVVFVVLLSTL